jgi:hypothetical protein
VSLGGVPLLDLVRPPRGYSTESAVVTTYSADLVTCLAVVAALDGAGSDGARVGRVDAVRALDHLRDRVRLVAHEGRLQCHGGPDVRLVALLDRLVRTVAFDGRRRSFHPKVAIARQVCPGREDRYVLYVGSRNLTMATDWDLGVGLVGVALDRPVAARRRIAGLDGFLGALRKLVGDETLGSGLSNLDEVAWDLPEGVDQIEFVFHGGLRRSFEQTRLCSLPRGERVLLVSPFLTSGAVASAAKYFQGAESLRLVAGRAELDDVARSRHRSLLSCLDGPVEALAMCTASDEARAPSDAQEDPEQQQEDRGLHAKACAVIRGDKGTLLVGSANLTSAAWTGENWEAFVVARCERALVDALWEWSSSRATPYRDPPEADPNPTDAPDPIDAVRNEIATLPLSIRESGGVSVVECAGLGAALERSGCALTVGRLTTAAVRASWPAGEDSVELPGCRPHEWTRFLVLTASCRGERAEWVQVATATPAPGEERDREAVVHVLGADFLAYLASEMGAAPPPDAESDGTRKRRSGALQRDAAAERAAFTLEDLVAHLGREPARITGVEETLARYRTALEKAPLDARAREELERFLQMWRIISEGMRMP